MGSMGISARLVGAVLACASASCAYGWAMDVGSTRRTTVEVAETTCDTKEIGYTKIANCVTGPTTELTQGGGSPRFGVMAGVHGGGNVASVGDASGSGWVLETFLEVLGGRRRWALGVRTGLMIRKSDDVDIDGDGDGEIATAYGGMPLTVHGYYGLSERVSTHVGLGGDMFAFGDNPRAVRIMSGLRLALSAGDESATMLILDVDHLRSSRDAGEYRSFGLIGGLAIVR